VKPRHAAALALVGWYLMIPPPHSRSSNSFEQHPPLAQWSVYRKYDSADECELSRLNIAGGMLQDPPADFVQRFGNNFMSFFERAQCIESDDRGLKLK
jgi:hypothetical protein